MDALPVGQCWLDMADALGAGMDRILLYGPPGTGKTFAALHHSVGDEVGERLVCTEDLTSGEILGMWVPQASGAFTWREGPAIRAWRGAGGRGGRLVVDEVDRASGDALSTLLAVTDSPASARWRNPDTLEWLRPCEGFSVIMTTNVEHLLEIPEALRDRFPVAIRIDQPHPKAVARLSSDLQAVALAGSLGPSGRRVSLRKMFAFDQLRNSLGTERAATLVFGQEAAGGLLDALSIGGVS